MEKLEKEIKYFIRIVEKMKDRGEIPTSILNRIIKDTDKEFGVITVDKFRYFKITQQLEKVLGKNLSIRKDPSAKTRGRQAFVRTYKLISENDEELDLLKSDIVSYFKRSEVLKTGVGGKDEGESKERKRRIKKSFLVKFWNLLSSLKKEEYSFTEIKNICHLGTFNRQVMENWKSTLEKVGVDLNVVIIDSGHEKNVRFLNLKNTMAQTAKAMNRLFPENMVDVTKLLGMRSASKVTPATTTIVKEKENNSDIDIVSDHKTYSLNYIYYAAGGIIKLDESRKVEINSLLKYLREGFGVVTTKKDLLDLIRKAEKYFEILNHGDAIKLLNWKSWEEIKEKFGPQNFKKELIVRLGMTEDEVKTLVQGPEVSLVSKISDNDGIYCIKYDMSISHRRVLIRLYRTFRGNDMILNDKKLEEELKKESIILEARSYKSDIAYNIENL